MATKTLNIALDDQLIQEIDQAVKKDMGSRSEYFRRLAMADLERRNQWKDLFDASNAKGQSLGLMSESMVAEKLSEYKREKQQ